ncbi:MAG: hypothetical protein D6785_07145 [Planctomycetota bacterium]|nr:MAG: hypothetical protein D6785_07145 [Planctomycetota bacterium]
MKHKSVERNLAKYLAGELSPPEKAKIESHLQICTECERKLDEIFEFEKSLQSLFIPHRAPQTLAQEILSKIEKKEVLFEPLPKGHTTIVVASTNHTWFQKFWKRLHYVFFLLILLGFILFWIYPLFFSLSSLKKGKKTTSKSFTSLNKNSLRKKKVLSPSPFSKEKETKRVSNKSKIWNQYEKNLNKALDFCYGWKKNEK